MSHTDLIACLDVGTTIIRCHVINSKCEVISTAYCHVNLLYPKPGYVEIDPDQLWTQVKRVITEAIDSGDFDKTDIKSLAISTQRSTFTTWRKDTGETFHNFITWKDLRAKDLCKNINSSFTVNGIRLAAQCAHLLTRKQRYLAGSKLKITPLHVTSRLLWVLQHNSALKKAMEVGNAMFGTLDTWLVYKLTNGRLHVTDISNASATAFYDPFVLDWGSWAINFLNIPAEILPEVVSNDYDFGNVDREIFGISIPIGCVMADQSSSMIGTGCQNTDDLKVTLGTGAFLDVNTGTSIHGGVCGNYPLVAWKIDGKLVYMTEVPCNDCGSLIEWLLTLGFIEKPEDTEEASASVNDNDGVYFIPAFSGLGPPINDTKAASGFLGIKPTTQKNHLVRAVMEGIVYRAVLAYETMLKERPTDYKKISVDGGVSKNNFVCQLLSDLTGLMVERLNSTEMSSRGIGLVAGIRLGLWSFEDLQKFRIVERIFKPNGNVNYRKICKWNFERWLEVVGRFESWYLD